MKEKGGLEAIGHVAIIHNLAVNNRRNWKLMDEGIGRWTAYLQRTKPELINQKIVLILFIFDSIKIQVANIISTFRGHKEYRDPFRRVRSYKAEVLNPTLTK